MAESAGKRNGKTQNVYETFIATVLDHREWDPQWFYRREEHRTYEWYILAILQEAEQAGWDKITLESSRANKNTRALVDEAFRALHVIVTKKNLLPFAHVVLDGLREAAISGDQFERLMYHFTGKLREFVAATKRHDDLRGVYRLVPGPKRRPPRDRSELPDPAAPSWASANRLPSRKLQVAFRTAPKIKEQSLEAAVRRKVSYSQWLNEAIVRQLQEEGYDAQLSESFRPPPDREAYRRRPQRPKRTQPARKGSHQASRVRASKVVSIRIDPVLAHHIQKEQFEDEDRSYWFSSAVQVFMRSGEPLPGERVGKPRYSMSMSISFDPQLFELIEWRVKEAGLTLSDWLRRIAYWYILYLRS